MNFIGIPSLPCLAHLQLDGNPIESFKGCHSLPQLYWLSMHGCPVADYRHFQIMCLCAFGPQVRLINDNRVTETVRNQAIALRPSVIRDLEAGRILVELNPVRVREVSDSPFFVTALSGALEEIEMQFTD
jgi:hypothetical protein